MPARKPHPSIACEVCGTIFTVRAYRAGTARFCSRACGNKVKAQISGAKLTIVTPELSEKVTALYTQGKTVPEIAEQLGISNFPVLKVLKTANIPRRMGNRHPWSEVTREKNKTRNVGPKNYMYLDLPIENILALYQEGMTALHIAGKLGVSETAVLTRLRKSGIKLHEGGYSSFRVTKDGHKVQSALEEAVDNWLYEHGIAHAIQPRCPWPAKHKSHQRADFKVGNTYIEVWGVTGNKKYKANREAKVANYLAYGANLIELYPKQIHSDDYSPLEQLLTL